MKKRFLLIAFVLIISALCLSSCGKDIQYSSNGDGTCSIIRVESKFCPVLNLPEKSPDGDIVTKIEVSSLWSCNGLIKVKIPDTVTDIDRAFQDCQWLMNVKIPDSVTKIDGAFGGCNRLKRITIPESVTVIGEGAFLSCTNLKKITLHDGITEIGHYAFAGCRSLKQITIPDGVTIIGDQAFDGCESLKSITIPDSVTSIGDFAFTGCASINDFDIPEGVKHIGRDAFCETGYYNNESNWDGEALYLDDCLINVRWTDHNGYPAIESIVDTYEIKSGTRIIAGGVFYYSAYKLKAVVIPSSVTSIGKEAFNGWRKKDRQVYYAGSNEDFAKISIGEGNENLLDATFNYNYSK